jgi:transcriptional regulator with XRE-family HTH domain
MNPESIYRHIGEIIRNRRRSSRPRLTQEMLAQRVGISRASLANIETGRQSVLVHQGDVTLTCARRDGWAAVDI